MLSTGPTRLVFNGPHSQPKKFKALLTHIFSFVLLIFNPGLAKLMWPMTPYIRQGITQGNREKDPGDHRELLANSREPWDDSQSDHSYPCHLAPAFKPNYVPVVKCTWTSPRRTNIVNIHPHGCGQARSKAYSPGDRCGPHNRGDARPQSQEGNRAVSGNRTGAGRRF